MRAHGAGLAYRAELDGLRGVAVLGVVAFHLWPWLLPGGFLGVDAFFVLSGYLITSLLLAEHTATGAIHLPSFWARRARRLLPALFVMLAVVALAGALWWPAEDLARLRGDALAGLGYVANWRFVLEGDQYFDVVRGPSPLRHLWSLAIEEQAYVVWPLAVTLALRRGGAVAVRWVALGGAALSVLALAVLGGDDDAGRAYYGTDTRIHALLLGAGLATATALPTRLPRWLAPAALAAVLGLWASTSESDGWLFVWGLPVHALLVAAVLAGVATSPRLQAVLSTRPLVAVGKVSYGLYLWHWPVVVFLAPPRVGLDGPGLAALRLAVTVALTVASYRLVERPIRAGGAVRGRAAAVALPAATLATAAVIVVAAVGARPLPEYLEVGGPADDAPVVTLHEAPPPSSTASTPTTAGATPPAVHPTRVLLVGDSVAFTIQDELGAALAARGVAFAAATAVGCGAAAGVDPTIALVATAEGTPTAWADVCADVVPRVQLEGLASDPDLVVLASTWETSDRVAGGQLVRYGTPEWDRIVVAELDAAVARLSSRGAVVALATSAPPVDGELRTPPDDEGHRFRRYNQLLRGVHYAHLDRTVIVDFAGLVCGTRWGETCPTQLEGRALRPLDGIHFDDAGAGIVAERFADMLVTLDLARE